MYLNGSFNGLEYARRDREVAAAYDPHERRLGADRMTRLLPAEDRRLIDLILVQGKSHRDVAREIGVSAGVVSRRSRRLRNLLGSATARAIAEHLDSLPDSARQIAVDHFFSRLSVSILCKRHSIGRREVMAQLGFIRGWARALHRDTIRQTPAN